MKKIIPLDRLSLFLFDKASNESKQKKDFQIKTMSPPSAADAAAAAAAKGKKAKRPGDEVAKQIAKTKKKLKSTEVSVDDDDD